MMLSSDSQTSNINHLTINSAYICGQIARTSRGLLASKSPEQVLRHCEQFLNGLSLSGILRTQDNGTPFSLFFGEKLQKRHLVELQQINTQSAKIQRGKSILTFSTEHIYLLLKTENMETVFVDALLDNLAIFIDSIEAWFMQYNQQLQIDLDRQKNYAFIQQALLDANQQLTTASCLVQQSQDHMHTALSSEITQLFCSMGLEQTQEEQLLSHIETLCQQHEQTIFQYQDAGKALAIQLKETLQFVENELYNAPSLEQDTMEDESVTLF